VRSPPTGASANVCAQQPETVPAPRAQSRATADARESRARAHVPSLASCEVAPICGLGMACDGALAVCEPTLACGLLRLPAFRERAPMREQLGLMGVGLLPGSKASLVHVAGAVPGCAVNSTPMVRSNRRPSIRRADVPSGHRRHGFCGGGVLWTA
jgi:hypothetical protein